MEDNFRGEIGMDFEIGKTYTLEDEFGKPFEALYDGEVDVFGRSAMIFRVGDKLIGYGVEPKLHVPRTYTVKDLIETLKDHPQDNLVTIKVKDLGKSGQSLVGAECFCVDKNGITEIHSQEAVFENHNVTNSYRS